VPSADSSLFQRPAATREALDTAPFTTADLIHAWKCCRKSKRNSASALSFELDAERHLMHLRDALLARTWRPGRSICFVSTRPKVREVWAAPFEDRVVHHLLYNHISPRFERAFIHNTAACIKGRGTLFAALRLEGDVRSATQNWQHGAYYLKCDLSNFFVSIKKPILRERLHRRIPAAEGAGFWRWLADTILMHDPREDFEQRGDRSLFARVPAHKRLLNAPALTGLPIGNLPSQFFANVLLDGLDQHAKHSLRMRWYGRYVDDFYMLHPSAQHLNEALADLTTWLPEHLGCHLNPRKTVLQPLERGIDFVGQVIKPWRRTPRASTVATALHRLADMPAEELFTAGNSYLGLFGQASHGHSTQAKVARTLRRRGHAVAGDLSKAYRSKHDQL
jgi:RNA-directed DNA polymerase